MPKIIIAWAVLALALAGAPALAASEDADAMNLGEITVKGETLHRDDMPATVNVIDSEEIEKLVLIRPSDLLRQVPGVEVGNYNQGGTANVFSIRGFTGAGHGGDAAVYLDGIPLNEGESHADGYADMNVLIPLELDKVEIFKGPSSPLFGNFARGGTVAFYTRQRGQYNKTKLTYGSFQTVDAQGAFGVKLGKLYNNTAVQGFHTDGYQDNSRWTKFNAATRFTYDFSDRLDVSAAFRAHASEWDAPGYIPEAQFNSGDDRRHQAVNAENDGGKKTFFTERLDVGYTLASGWRLLAWLYGTQQDFTRFAKFGYQPGGQTERYYDRAVWGSGFSLNADLEMGGHSLTGVLGLEYYNENTDWKRWDTSNRVRTAQTQDRSFLITTASVFGQVEYELSRYFRPSLGFRYDVFGGDYQNRDPGAAGFERDMNDYSHFSPKLGFKSMILKNLDLRASYCEGFALPDGEAKYAANLDVDPEVFRQYEAGLTYRLPGLLWLDAAYFIIDSDGEILEDPPGSGKFRNVGQTRRQGVETGVKLWPLKGLMFYANLALLDSDITSNPDKSLEGKQITGMPESIMNLGLEYTSALGLGGRVGWRQVGKYYLDGLNTQTYDGYDVVDMGVFYIIKADHGAKLKLGFDIKNLFDEAYAQSVWYGYGTKNYAVAWPRTYWVSLSLDW